MNYMILRDAVVSPFIRGEQNTSGKIATILGVLSVLSTCYAMQFVAIESAIALFFCCGLFALLIDVTTSGIRYKPLECAFILLAVVGVFFIMRPPFLFGKLGEAHYIGHWTKDGWHAHGVHETSSSEEVKLF